MSIVAPFLLLIIVAFIIRIIRLKAQAISGRNTKRILLGYISFLVVASAVIYVVIPSSNYSDGKKQQEGNNSETYIEKVPNIEDMLEKKRWDLPIQDDILNIRIMGNLDAMRIIAEKSTDVQQNIEVIHYISNNKAYSFDYSNIIKSPQIDLEKDTLLISQPIRPEIKLVQFHNDFSITQFTGEKMFSSSRRFSGYQVLYLKVPSSIKIDAGNEVNLEIKGE